MNQNTNFHILWKRDITEVDPTNGIYGEYRNKWHMCPETSLAPSFPLFLDIEATSYCNLKCPHCLYGQKKCFKGNEMGYMPLKIYLPLIDEASTNGCYGCKFHTISRGEPLLNADLPTMIAYAKKKGLIDVYLNTNATLLTENKSRALLDAGLDRISFSLDGLHQKYEGKRIGASFRRVVSNIIKFMEITVGGCYNTKIRIQTVRLPDIDLELFVQNCKYLFGFGLDEIAAIDYKDMTIRRYNEGPWKCPQPWQRMSVLWDGTILPCNHDDRQYAKLGVFPEMSIRKAWDSSGMRMIRDMHNLKKGFLVAACNGCFLAQSEIEKMGYDIP